MLEAGTDNITDIMGKANLIECDFEFPQASNSLRLALSPYAVNKVAQDLVGYQYYKSYGMRIVRTRVFNHTGPRRGDAFASSNFAKQIAMIEAGKREPVIRVGNLESKRDFSNVRNVVCGYWLVAERGKPGEVYNIASGKMIAIHDMLEILLSLSPAKVRIEVDPDRLRPSDVLVLQGDSGKIRDEVGWHPEIPLEKTLKDLLNYWRERVQGGSEIA